MSKMALIQFASDHIEHDGTIFQHRADIDNPPPACFSGNGSMTTTNYPDGGTHLPKIHIVN